MALGGKRSRTRYGTAALLSDVLVVGAAARKLARRGQVRPRGSGPRELLELGELVVAAGALLRLARYGQGRLRRRRATAP